MASQDSSACPSYSLFGLPPRGRNKPLLASKEEMVAGEACASLMVLGKHALLFDSDVEAEFTNSAESLLPWNGDEKLMIDRYDVRHLLQDLSGLRRKNARPLSPDATREELDYERYRDLNDVRDHEMERDENAKRQKTSGYQIVGFTYDAASLSQDVLANLDSTVYHPPFAVPNELETNLPASEKVHQIIAGTAKFVSEHGGQSEIVLRVKQANNPSFSFLMPENRLHSYYRYLVEHPTLLGASSNALQKSSVYVDKSSEGLSMLGDIYGDDDEEEDIAGHTTLSADSSKISSIVEERGASSPSDSVTQDGSWQEKPDFTLSRQCTEQLELHDLSTDIGHYGVVSPVSCHSGCLEGELVCEDQVNTSPNGFAPPLEPPPPGTELVKHNEQGNAMVLLEKSLVHPDTPFQTGDKINETAKFNSYNGKTHAGLVQERFEVDGMPLPSNNHSSCHSKALRLSKEAENDHEPLRDEGSRCTIVTGSSGKSMQILKQKQYVPKSTPRSRSLTLLPGMPKSDLRSLEPDVCGLSMLKTHEVADNKARVGISSDAAAAVVRAATRGHLQFSLARKVPKEMDAKSKQAVKGPEKQQTGGMSLDAAAEAVMEATHGPWKERRDALARKLEHSKLTDSGTLVGKFNVLKDSAETLKGRDLLEGSLSSGWKENVSAPDSGESKPAAIHNESHLLQANAKVVTKAAAAAAALEADSADAKLTAEEKRKLERLKKAKLFTSMMQSGVNFLEKVERVSDGVSLSLNMDTSVQPAGSCIVQVPPTDDDTMKPVEALCGVGSDVEYPGSIQEDQALEADPPADILAAGSVKEKAGKRREKQHRHHHRHRHRHRHHHLEDTFDQQSKSHDEEKGKDISNFEQEVDTESLHHVSHSRNEDSIRHVRPHTERKEEKILIERGSERCVLGINGSDADDWLTTRDKNRTEDSIQLANSRESSKRKLSPDRCLRKGKNDEDKDTQRCKKIGKYRNRTNCKDEGAEACSYGHSSSRVRDLEISDKQKIDEAGRSNYKPLDSANKESLVKDLAPSDTSEDLRAKVRAMLRQIQ